MRVEQGAGRAERERGREEYGVRDPTGHITVCLDIQDAIEDAVFEVGDKGGVFEVVVRDVKGLRDVGKWRVVERYGS